VNLVCTTKIALCRASQINFCKILKSFTADVAELVDARDLKFVRSDVSVEEFCTTRRQKPMKTDRNTLDLHNISECANLPQ
jgi:hypothetical protein